MPRKYLNPPVIEAVCEFRLTPDSKWDLTVPGLIYEKVSKEFPNKEQRLIQEVEITHGPQGIQQQLRTSERVLFLTNERKIFIQVGPHFLAINSLKPYPTWDGFKPWIEKAFNALVETVNVERLHRIGLRYINRIEIPSQSVKLEDYFEFYPFLGNKLPQVMANFLIQSLIPFFDERDSCKVHLTNAVSDKPGNISFLLDLDFFLAKPQVVSASQALEWVESAHHRVEELFEGCITERLREIFQEVK